MSNSNELAVQGSLAPEIFSRFINLKVGMNLSGSASFELEELQKVMSGDPLTKGTELVITARYFIKDVRMPVERKDDYSVPYEQRQKAPSVYQLGGAKLELSLIGVEKVESKAGRIKQSVAAPCSCLIQSESGSGRRPDGYREAAYPLKGFWAKQGCEECQGKGYVFPRENKAPLANRQHASYGSVVVLVDELPEPPDIPEGSCQTCGMRGHRYDCPVRLEEEKAAKKVVAEAKKAYKEATGTKAPECYGNSVCYRGQDCEARKQCLDVRSPKPEARPQCFGTAQLSDDCDDCECTDVCVEQAELNQEAGE